MWDYSWTGVQSPSSPPLNVYVLKTPLKWGFFNALNFTVVGKYAILGV